MDLYLIVCIGLVFIALMEFAIVLFVNRRNEGTIPEETKEISSLNFPDDSMTTNERKKIEVLKNGWMQKPSIFNSFDRISIFQIWKRSRFPNLDFWMYQHVLQFQFH